MRAGAARLALFALRSLGTRLAALALGALRAGLARFALFALGALRTRLAALALGSLRAGVARLALFALRSLRTRLAALALGALRAGAARLALFALGSLGTGVAPGQDEVEYGVCLVAHVRDGGGVALRHRAYLHRGGLARGTLHQLHRAQLALERRRGDELQLQRLHSTTSDSAS